MKNDLYEIDYEFIYEDGSRMAFNIGLDRKTITYQRKESQTKPEWARLENEQCSNCSLRKEEHPYCPICLNIGELVEAFRGMLSTGNCTVICTTEERTFSKETSTQVGLFSIFGIIMATSNCPVIHLFKPMARFHLPFSSIEETMVRTASYYLLRQYFEYKKGKVPDIDLKKLDQYYSNIQIVNQGILARITNLVEKDAEMNAIVILNSLAQMFNLEFDESLDSLEYLFTC
ncbi:hypothetical protein KKA14_05120 [bacterium]|nr:hypothetical protein [bacterium]